MGEARTEKDREQGMQLKTCEGRERRELGCSEWAMKRSRGGAHSPAC